MITEGTVDQDHITRLRRDDHIYRVAASVRVGDAGLTRTNSAALEKAFPDLDPVAYAKSMAFDRDADRQLILDALEASRRLA